MSKSTLRKLAALVFAAAVAAGSATAEEITIEHAQGTTVLPEQPTVVFSYDYASIDTLTSLGVSVAGAPPLAGRSPAWIPEGLTDIGSLFEPDYEQVNASQPDLTVVAGRSADAYPELARMTPTIDLTFGDSLYGGLQDNTRTLAAIFGLEAEAEEELAALDGRVSELKDVVADSGDGLLMMVSGGSLSLLNPSTATAGRGALLFQTLGLEPTIADVDSATHGEPVSFEFLLRYDPDWLFVIDRDAAIGTEDAQPAATVLDNELMQQTQAWQNDRIIYVDPFNWYMITGAGLTTMNEMLDEIEAAFGR